jgi:hypothetical protein
MNRSRRQQKRKRKGSGITNSKQGINEGEKKKKWRVRGTVSHVKVAMLQKKRIMKNYSDSDESDEKGFVEKGTKAKAKAAKMKKNWIMKKFTESDESD